MVGRCVSNYRHTAVGAVRIMLFLGAVLPLSQAEDLSSTGQMIKVTSSWRIPESSQCQVVNNQTMIDFGIYGMCPEISAKLSMGDLLRLLGTDLDLSIGCLLTIEGSIVSLYEQMGYSDRMYYRTILEEDFCIPIRELLSKKKV